MYAPRLLTAGWTGRGRVELDVDGGLFQLWAQDCGCAQRVLERLPALCTLIARKSKYE